MVYSRPDVAMELGHPPTLTLDRLTLCMHKEHESLNNIDYVLDTAVRVAARNLP